MRQPPALAGRDHLDRAVDSRQVLLKLSSEVLIRWVMERSVNWTTKSSQGILRS